MVGGCDAKNVLEKHPAPEFIEKCTDDITQQGWNPLTQIIQDQ